jgi:hypothetical protein
MGKNIVSRWLPILLVLLVAAAGITAYVSWRNKDAGSVAADEYSVAKGDVVSSVVLTGNVVAGDEAAITAPVAGTLTWKAANGKPVTADQVIAEIATQSSGTKFVQDPVYVALLHEADLKIFAATQNYNTDPSSNNARLLADARGERAALVARASEFRAVSVKGAGESVQVVKATSAGVLVSDDSLVKVAQGQKLGAIQSGALAIQTPLADSDITNVIGKQILISQNGQVVRGQIAAVDHGKLSLTLPPQTSLIEGEVQVEIVFDIKKDVVAVPKEAVVFRDNKWWVQKSAEKEMTEVAVGVIGNDYIEITGGLSEGDLIEPSNQASDNQ